MIFFYRAAVQQLVASWCLLVPAGAGWCRQSAGWCRLVPAGAGWCRQSAAGWTVLSLLRRDSPRASPRRSRLFHPMFFYNPFSIYPLFFPGLILLSHFFDGFSTLPISMGKLHCNASISSSLIMSPSFTLFVRFPTHARVSYA